MYAARTWTRVLKRHLLGSAKYPFRRWQQTAAMVAQEPFLNGSSSNYVEEMYLSWKQDPKSVHRVGNYSILYVSVHGNILFTVIVMGFNSTRESERYLCFKAVGFEENTNLLMQFFCH